MSARSDHMTFAELRPGMIFVDASKPTRNRRLVVLKVYTSRWEAWVCAVGSSVGPYRVTTGHFYWGGLTPHNKPRRSGYYLDPDIPGNTKEKWKRVPNYG